MKIFKNCLIGFSLVLNALSGRGQDTLQLVKMAANPTLKESRSRNFFIGKNYRKEWTAPVSAPVLNLKKAGLVPKKEGGGKETRSLKVEDATGHSFSLRSVRKYPEKVVPDEFKNTLIEKIVVDDISASYPYGALSMPILSNAAGVPYLKDSLIYLPDDPELGKYGDKYKNSLYLMEDREPFGIDLKEEKNKDEKSISTEELVYKLADKNKNKVNQLAVLRARLLDNFVMDFDRHEGQWNWIAIDSGKLNVYYPVPKDRDQVFYTNQGLLPKIMRAKTRLPELHGLSAQVKDVNAFNRAARNFDRSFLTELTAEDWSRELDHFLTAMTDSVIETALAQQPKEIRGYAAKQIIQILKEKRNYFKADMMNYYAVLSKETAVVGSNEREQFSISQTPNGQVSVTVQKLDSEGKASAVLYNRVFDPSVTKEIRLYGLEGDDRFIVNATTKLPIKIRMIGGPGRDEFINKGNAHNTVAYDVDFEKNHIDKGIRNRINSDPQNNTYSRLGNNFNFFTKGPTGELSTLQGISLGYKMKVISQVFRKDPYGASHLFLITHALGSSSFHVRYYADFIKVFRNTDLLVRSDYIGPTSRTNFFGMGNETVKDEALFKAKYYRSRYTISNTSVLASTRLGNYITVEYGPAFQYLQLRPQDNINKFISAYYPGTGHEAYHKKYYGGGEFHFNLNSKTNEKFPTGGVKLFLYARALKGLNEFSHHLTQTGGSFAFYSDLKTKGRFVFATEFGGGHNSGKYEFEQSQFLGYKDHLRGYRLQRFAGRSMAYNNTELRWKLANANYYLFRGAVGLVGFHDEGRVWADGETSSKWHQGYGGGVWISALNRFILSGYTGFSAEEKGLLWASVGFTF